nr:ATP synthase F0 subunit 8 [Heterochaeta sp. JZ-2017]
MPQMMPLNWFFMFLFFSNMFIMFNMMNYFSSIIQSNPKSYIKTSLKFLTWKW